MTGIDRTQDRDQESQPLLRLPLAEAESSLKAQIYAGELLRQSSQVINGKYRLLAARNVLSSDFNLDEHNSLIAQIGEALPRLLSDLEIWSDYNQAWLDRFIGGTAADEYRTTRNVPWPEIGQVGNAFAQGALGMDIHDSRIRAQTTKLQSILGRLSLWIPSSSPYTPAERAGTDAATGSRRLPAHTPDAPIFIVHGSDTVRARAVAHTVERATGRQAIILRDQPNRGQTIIEKFEQHAAHASYAVVILTPDDHGARKQESLTSPRARQNVIFEMGYFCGMIGRRRICALLSPVLEKPSDIEAIAYIAFDEGDSWKYELLRELDQAGFKVAL
jgi:predicted nucleotide-binding protein